MRGDREYWDRKYAEGGGVLEGPPIPLLVRWLPRLPRGRALDIAAGCGRHAVFLAEHGYRVDALDISPLALARLVERARQRGVQVRAAVVDLDEIALPPATYDLVVNTYYLNRRLLAQVPSALRPGGALVVETPLAERPEDPSGDARHRLGPGEIATLCGGLVVAEHEETPAGSCNGKYGLCRFVAFRPREEEV